MSPHNPEYDLYDAKHFARYRGWLPASKAFVRESGKTTIKYFTLCAAQAIDVFMFEREGLLRRDDQDQLHDVVICEKNEEIVPEILELVRPPLREALIVGKLEDILLADISQSNSSEDPRSLIARRNQRNREHFMQLERYFPFDVINFDTCGSLVNKPLDANRLLAALDRVFELQQSASSFLLFVTTPISDLCGELEGIFRERLSENVRSHNEIHQALVTSTGSVVYDEIERRSRIALGFAKSILLPMAQKHGWNALHKGIYVYNSPSGRTTMMSSVVKLSATRSESDSGTYISDIVQIIRNMPRSYSSENSQQKDEVRRHLGGIIDYREEVRSRYTLSR
jgi:hypothetical protein